MQNQCNLNVRSKCILNALRIRKGRHSKMYGSRDSESSCLNLVYRHPSQLSVPKVPTTVPPQLQLYWLKI